MAQTKGAACEVVLDEGIVSKPSPTWPKMFRAIRQPAFPFHEAVVRGEAIKGGHQLSALLPDVACGAATTCGCRRARIHIAHVRKCSMCMDAVDCDPRSFPDTTPSLTRNKKLQMLSSWCYCPHTAWSNKMEMLSKQAVSARFFAFPIRSETNAEVLSRANHRMLSEILQYRQIMWLKRVADLPSENVMRTCVFQSDSFNVVGLQGSAADEDAPGNLGLWKCTGLLKAWPIMTVVRLTVCGSCLFLNGSGGLQISVLVA